MAGHDNDEDRLEARIRFLARIVASGVLLALVVGLCLLEGFDSDYDLDVAKLVLFLAAILLLLDVRGVKWPGA